MTEQTSESFAGDAVTFYRSDRLLRRKEVERLTGLSRPTIYRQMKNGTFPRPRRIGVQAVAWFYSEIAEWQRQQPVVSPDS